MAIVQLDFFKTEDQYVMESTVMQLKISTEKVRRGMYAKLNEITQKQVELDERLIIIESNLCKGIL